MIYSVFNTNLLLIWGCSLAINKVSFILHVLTTINGEIYQINTRLTLLLKTTNSPISTTSSKRTNCHNTPEQTYHFQVRRTSL